MAVNDDEIPDFNISPNIQMVSLSVAVSLNSNLARSTCARRDLNANSVRATTAMIN